MLRLTTLVLSLSVVTMACAQAPQAPVAINPAAMKWQASSAMPGADSLFLIGAANASGIYAQRVKLAKGAMIPPHTHSDERFSVVISGTIYVGFTETFDESAVVAIPAGALYVAPAGVPHFVWAKDGDAEYQESGVGPSVTSFIPKG